MSAQCESLVHRRYEAVMRDIVRVAGHWNAESWAVPVGESPGRTRADVAYGCAQELADLAADAEDRLRRQVPRLDDGALVDQLVVLANDLSFACQSSERQMISGLDVLEKTQRCLVSAK